MRCLFLMGAHRSGTTWLHQLLDSSHEIGCITYWDVLQKLNHQATPLSRDNVERELGNEGESRGFDNVRVGLDLPEEYGWLLPAGALDLYTRRPISNTDFAPLLDLIETKREQPQQPPWLLLKNPTDFYDGFARLDHQFPESFFLFLHRHPLAVFRSQVTSWRRLWEQPNHYLQTLDKGYARAIADPIQRRLMKRSLYSHRFLETMLLTLAESFELHVQKEADMKAASMRLRYEDLCSDPGRMLQEIASWLQLKQPLLAVDALAVNPRSLGDDPLIQAVYTAHSQRFKAYCDWLHYAVEG